MEAVVALFIIIALALILIAALGIRIIRPYERGLIEMLGRYQRTVDSGLRWILPFVQRISKVDMRERVIDVPPQEVITKDNVVVTVDAVIFFEATDPVKLKYNVGNFQLAVTKLAQTNLRNVVGDLDLDAALTSRELINGKLRQILDDATDKWGTRVVRVEIQRIEPPPDVTEAMHRQMKAERDRRAIVTEAEGDKRSAILRSEGLKQSQILEAEGEAEAIKRVADAERYQLETVAQGEGDAIQLVFNAIHAGDPTPDLIAIRYLEALKNVADGQATKIFLPLDTSGLTNAMASLSEIARAGQGEPAARAVEE
ncbi:MAG: SPFH/Band 7/PHB domain protein [Acidimicrobiia bacterium]|nr:SPFH/Band 7/PHB domain protein [Acidimicrobiia bacterium]MYB10769.1 SPFH/Band 7/PHB domain protein [Acidimicrobiia bacterium]MYB73624.1 SPFH/Band 7/PHB domain protein [Acidimicrobiia bacterium]MYG57056.1 SPFH/Band 7/PHB domain protein [Acidimicrobiia bacterium]MYH98222.1 SPFH/Band 7/PHB domain protein [Acidimicrobiia bacterium]